MRTATNKKENGYSQQRYPFGSFRVKSGETTLFCGPQAHTKISLIRKIIQNILERNMTLYVVFIRWFIFAMLKIQLVSPFLHGYTLKLAL